MILYVFLLIIIAYSSMKLFNKLNWTVANFEGKQVPYSLGIYVFISYVLFQLLFIEQTNQSVFWIYCFGIWFSGMLDDWFGNKNEKGLRGHLRAFLLNGTISTGIIKILATVVLALYVIATLKLQTIDEWIRFGIILILTPHIMNLFDTRPLRVWKVSLLFGSLFFPFLQALPLSAYLYLLTFYFIFFVFEGHKLAMLGDNGATLIGAVFGVLMIMQTTIKQQWALIVIFFFLTIIAEKISFSRFIAKYRILKWIDQIGVHSSK